jgi:hypothetical protein
MERFPATTPGNLTELVVAPGARTLFEAASGSAAT